MEVAADADERIATVAATIINGMRPQTVGRALGIGLRVAGRIAGQRLAASAQPGAVTVAAGAAANSVGAQSVTANSARAARQTAGRASSQARGSLMQGVGGFLRPFGRVGGTVWLEVTGVFFLLPVIVFAPTVWRTRMSWAGGLDHRTFWASAVVVVVFLYLGVTSFWRARRR